MIHIERVEPSRLTGALLELWNRNLSDRFPLDERLLTQQLRMDGSEKTLIAAFDSEYDSDSVFASGSRTGPSGALLGAALVKRRMRPDAEGRMAVRGNLSFILVDGPSRGKGIGSRILAEAEVWLRDGRVAHLDFGRDRYHFFPGYPLDDSWGSAALEAFLAAKGFISAGIESDLYADLGLLDLGALSRSAPVAPEYRPVFYKADMRTALVDFFERNFPGRWLDDTVEALDAGMRDEDLLLLQKRKSETIAGFARIYDGESTVLGPGVYWRGIMGDAPGGLGPIGIDAGCRGSGLGLGLLCAGVSELARRGVRCCVIDWTDLESFYARMGFRVWKRYRMASKELAGGGRV